MVKKKDIDEEVLGESDNKKEITSDMIRRLMNKKEGKKVAFNLDEEDPTGVKGWIPTGSRWLDSIIARGMMAGIPMGKIIEISGLESSGKSYLAAQIVANAIKMKEKIKIVYFDSENAIDKEFWRRMGIDVSEVIYAQAQTTEFVLQTMLDLMASYNAPFLFVWDSLAMTATQKRLDVEGVDPRAMIAQQALVLKEGASKLTIPLANTNSTFLVLNQLKTKIPAPMYGTLYTTPGGLSIKYQASLRLWLTASKSNQRDTKGEGYIKDEDGDILGTSIGVRIEKSRFGGYGREADLDILWVGDEIGIQNESSFFEVIKKSDSLSGGAAGWWSLKMEDGSEVKFQGRKEFLEKLKEEKFKERVFQIMDQVLIHKE